MNFWKRTRWTRFSHGWKCSSHRFQNSECHESQKYCHPSTHFKSPPNLEPATSEPRKHCGMFPDDEILGFDNQFFNIPDKEAKYWPPCLRLCLEKSYESLQLHGYTRETVKGQSIALYNGVLVNGDLYLLPLPTPVANVHSCKWPNIW